MIDRRFTTSASVLLPILVAGCFQSEAPPPQPAATARAERAVSRVVARAPAELPEARQAPPATLVAELRKNPDPGARVEATYELADAVTANDVDFVGQVLADPDPEVRRAAVEALVASDSEVSVSYLSLALSDPDVLVRVDATEALGAIGTAEARSALQQAMLLDTDPRVRAAAEQMLAEPERKAR